MSNQSISVPAPLLRVLGNPSLACFVAYGLDCDDWFSINQPRCGLDSGLVWSDLGIKSQGAVDKLIAKVNETTGLVSFRFATSEESSVPVMLYRINLSAVESLMNQAATIPQSKPVSVGAPAVEAGSRFEDFWAVYPRREVKKEAYRIWIRRGLDRIADQIIADVQARKGNVWTERRFTPMPTTYLNGDRWLDEVPTYEDDDGLMLISSARMPEIDPDHPAVATAGIGSMAYDLVTRVAGSSSAEAEANYYQHLASQTEMAA